MTYPATFEVETPDKIANWRPLLQWFLAIPHLILLNALESLAGAVALIPGSRSCSPASSHQASPISK